MPTNPNKQLKEARAAINDFLMSIPVEESRDLKPIFKALLLKYDIGELPLTKFVKNYYVDNGEFKINGQTITRVKLSDEGAE
ncbi:hypothetical protein DRH27_02255 [Candidatus Falkowbacteria bacterium]|nr:MAG: hypothetical protein DRH27_02255 [Candidatus Falkowbacteria bacterium]